MRHIRLSAILAALLAAAALTACSDSPAAPTDTTADTTEAVTTPAPEPASLDLIAGGKTAFTIIRADEAEDDSTVELLKKIMNAFDSKAGVRITLGTDWVKKGTEPNAESYEILVGPTNHPESAQAMEGVKYRDYVVKMIGNKIVINGHTAETRSKAVNYFVTNILGRAEEGKDLVFTEADNYVSETSYMLDTVTLGGVDLAEYTITYPADAAYPAQDFARQLQTILATRSGIYLPIAESAEGKIIAVTVGDDTAKWSATLKDSTLTCTAGGMWGFDLMYDALYDTIREAKDTLALENGWSVSGDITASNDDEIARSLTIDGDVRVMFHNVWSGAVHNRDDMESSLFLAYMPDVLGMQEINPTIRNEKVSLFDLLAPEYTEVPVKATNKSGNNYTPIVYRADRVELIDSGWHLYDDKAGDQSKSVTWAIFKDKTTGRQFGVANTHFYWTSDALGQSARLIDAAEILQVVADAQAKYPVPFIIGGDLNCRVSAEPQLNLMKGGWKNAHNTATGYRSNTKGHHAYAPLDPITNLYSDGPLPSGDYTTAIDHIYTCGTGVEVRVFNTILHRYALDSSDHCPIYVDVKFTD